MDNMMLWNVLLTFALALAGFVVKFMWNEVQRIQILLNKTREEIYRNGLFHRRADSSCENCIYKKSFKCKQSFEAET